MKKSILGFLTFIACGLLIVGTGCSSNKRESAEKTSKATSSNNVQSVIREATNELNLKINLSIKKGEKVKLTPRTFIEIAIAFSLESIKWRQEFAKLKKSGANIDPENFFSEKRLSFYKEYGLTEEEYNKYGSTHSKEIAEYMAEHPELMNEYSRLQLPQNY